MAHNHIHDSSDHPSDDSDLLAKTAAGQYGLFHQIDFDRFECLNETTEGSGKSVFKAWDQRLDASKFVISDANQELLFNIPFAVDVKLKGIIVIGGDNDQGPNKMRMYKNRPYMTFDDVVGQADQEFELVQDNEGIIEYQPVPLHFRNVYHLTLHFPSNFAEGEKTKIIYLGLKGDFFTGTRKKGVSTAFETKPADSMLEEFDEYDDVLRWQHGNCSIDYFCLDEEGVLCSPCT